MEMAWTEARDFADACARIRRDALLDAAIAARAAQADEKSFKQFMRTLHG